MNNIKQQTLTPSYFNSFSCIGGECEETCCAGWIISIDDKTYKKYKKVKDPAMKARLDKELVAKKGNATAEYAAKIKLKNGRCAFLNKGDLCDIYIHLGKSFLSHTCTLYPRTINKIDGTLEYSMTLSCPEACRKILLNPEGIQFESGEACIHEDIINANIQPSSKGEKWQDYFLQLRRWMLDLLQDRRCTIDQRLYLLEQEVEQVDKFIRQGNIKRLPKMLMDLKAERPDKLDWSENSVAVSKEGIALAKFLWNMGNEKKFQSKRYTQCLEEVLLGFGFNEEGQVDLEKGKKLYEKGYENYYIPFIQEKGYILENYFVNYVFERCIPIDGQTVSESFERMNLYYKLFRMHLIGLGNEHKELTDELIVRMVQSFSRIFDHNQEFFKGVLEFAKYIN